MTKLADIGLIGLAVMGENLVLNMESKGITVAVFNRSIEKVDAFIKGRGRDKNIIGAYSLNMSVFDVCVMLLFGVFGYFMKKFDIPSAPMVIALVLGPMLEYSLYQALAVSHGSMSIFVTRPISAVLLGIAALMTIGVCFKVAKMQRAMLEDDE